MNRKRVAEKAIIEQLQKKILDLQSGKKEEATRQLPIGLGKIESAFPGGVFPVAAVHEFISGTPEQGASASGFISLILSRLMRNEGACLWVGSNTCIYPPALGGFGIRPERVVFVRASRPKDLMWTIEEGLKCEALAAVIGETAELTFEQSRRLQLAVERSRVTGFIHRLPAKNQNPVACVSRWTVTPVRGEDTGRLPGPGFPAWRVQLLKVRNGKPGEWLVENSPAGLQYLERKKVNVIHGLKTGSHG